MWNSFGTPEVFRHKIAILDEHCRNIGRDPATIEKSVLVSAANSAGPFEISDARRQIDEYISAGVTHIIFSVYPKDREWVRRFATEISPALQKVAMRIARLYFPARRARRITILRLKLPESLRQPSAQRNTLGICNMASPLSTGLSAMMQNLPFVQYDRGFVAYGERGPFSSSSISRFGC